MTLLSHEQGRMDSASVEGDVVSNSIAIASIAAGFVQQQFQYAQQHRNQHENRWLRWFDQFRGRYSPEERALLSKIKEKNPFASEAFIKVTKTKTLAAYGAILDVLVYGDELPFTIKHTPVPEGIAEKVYVDRLGGESSYTVEELAEAIGTPEKGLAPGTKLSDILGGIGKRYTQMLTGKKLGVGPSPDKTTNPEFYPAQEAVENMQKLINDQLLESDVQREVENMIWEMCLYGTGVIKGPFNTIEMNRRWDYQDGKAKFSPQYKRRPKLTSPSIWDIYPDPFARSTDEMDFCIERHRLTKLEVQKLKQQKNFKADLIDIALRGSPTVNYEGWENRLRDYNGSVEDNRYEVLEFWGTIQVDFAKQIGIENIDPALEDFEQVHVNIWTLGGYAIKTVINPFIPDRIPYRFVPYETNKYQIWGIGVPENMEDAQSMINVHTRAAQDNLRLAGSVMLEVNEAQLKPGQDNTIYAGKIWRKQGGAPGQSIYPISFNNTAPQHLQFIGEANRWADQSSGIPSVMHGQTGVSGTGRTATTMSMIMNSGNLSIRTVVKNIDREFIKPIVTSYFDWNMQFNEDSPEIRGDIRIVAGGTAALAQREVQSQRLLTFLQTTANPVLAPYANLRYIVEELASSLSLDKSRATNDPEVTKLIMEMMQQGAQDGRGTPQGFAQQPQQGGGGMPPQAVSPSGANGGAGLNGGELGVGPSPTTG